MTNAEVFFVPLIDGLGHDLRQVAKAVALVADVVAAGERVLVRCHAGRSRSVVVVARCLMQAQDLSALAALSQADARSGCRTGSGRC